ncbi:hypothetical protein RPATATE_0125 [Rickettsia parkeri str. Tate's Hell]|uniref:Variable large protein n=1 Tax=Rickettsia parkeri str. Tate's Hell TaxID=1359189 RepID=A0ABR5DND9_RICPA|nr:hypothetical protein [Rickettsia parkeri]KJV93422.1 hypothetical protein RPAGB_0167 [Rickettsia parkeri str. Grand Bay]KJV96646.1 hypothetical protein RPAAT24_0797 [Rickettsia parkeri str. AT\
MEENKVAGKIGGSIAKNAKTALNNISHIVNGLAFAISLKK